MAHAARRHSPLPALFLVLLTGIAPSCVSDFDLLRAPKDPSEEAITPAPPARPEDPPPSFPWGELDPGNLPEIYFAVAWSPWNCGLMQDGSDELVDTTPARSDSEWVGCPVYFAVIDLLGHVVTEVQLPLEQPDWTPYTYLSLSPAGPGEFLAVVENWGGEIDGGSSDSFWNGTMWEAWRGDGVTGDVTQIARWDPATQEGLLPLSGRHFQLSQSFGTTQFAMWPGSPDWLLSWSTSLDCSDGLDNLRAVHVSSPSALDIFWVAEDLLPDDLLAEAEESGLRWMPWNLDAGQSPEGDNQLLLGLTGACSPDNTVQRLVSWSLADGPLWSADLPLDNSQSASFSTLNGGGALQLANDGTAWFPNLWRITGPDGAIQGSLSADDSLVNHRQGPLLDPSGPSFLVVSTQSPQTGGVRDVVDLYHEGTPVWRIDQLRFGLQWRDVNIVDIVVLPALQE